MHTPDQADIDPRNPLNYRDDVHSFIVAEYKWTGRSVTISDVLLKDFQTEEEAQAALLALTAFNGDELSVVQVDEDGDDTVCFCAEWDEETSRYVKA